MKLSPSILAADFCVLGSQIEEAASNGADYIHVDVMDGLFVPSISFGMPVISTIRKATDIPFDVHLMIEDPIRYIDEFARIGADLITVHIEACKDVKETLKAIKNAGCKVGLSIKPGTPTEELFPYLNDIDMALIMTVEPGFGGQKLIEATLDKVSKLRKYITDNGLCVDIEVDGGITKENIDRILEAGANVVVAGSAIFKGDIGDNVKFFKLKDKNL